MNKDKLHKCEYCGNETKNKKFCSIRCNSLYQAENKTGLHSKKSKQKGIETNRKNKTGIFDVKTQQKSVKTNRKNKTSCFFDKVSQDIGRQIQKKNKLGWYDSKIQRKGGKAAVKVLRNNSKYTWLGVNFMSKAEMNVAKAILTKPILNVNCSISVGSKTIDFFPQSYDKMHQNKFVEYHCFGKDDREAFVYSSNLTREEYYNSRRKVLDDNGYQNKELVVIS